MKTVPPKSHEQIEEGTRGGYAWDLLVLPMRLRVGLFLLSVSLPGIASTNKVDFLPSIDLVSIGVKGDIGDCRPYQAVLQNASEGARPGTSSVAFFVTASGSGSYLLQASDSLGILSRNPLSLNVP